MTISETSTEIIRKFIFLPCLKRANPEENLDLFKQRFLFKQFKGDKLKRANSEENLDLFKQLFLIKPVNGDKY